MAHRSQLGQDQWVLATLGGRRGGYFVDVGAADGMEHSNTLVLERDFGWTGICIEPSVDFTKLVKNRKCACVEAVVLDGVQFVDFKEAGLFGGVVEHLTPGIADPASMAAAPVVSKTSRTLASVLDEQLAPQVIDFLSLDTEGTESLILSVFPFDRYCFRTICVEHNNVLGNRDALRRILRAQGYKLVGGADFDGAFMPDGGGQDDYWLGPCV